MLLGKGSVLLSPSVLQIILQFASSQRRVRFLISLGIMAFFQRQFPAILKEVVKV